MRVSDSEFACPVCSAEGTAAPAGETRLFPGECRLRDLPDGARTHVRELRGCRHLRSRLYSLGLVPGTAITVHGRGDAGCRVEVRDTCLVLDCESASSILCDAVAGEAVIPCRDGSHGLFGCHGRKGRKGEQYG